MSSVSPKKFRSNFHHKNLSSSHLQMVTPWNNCSFTRRVIPPDARLALGFFLLYKEKLVYPSKFTCSSVGNQVSTNAIKSNLDISFLKVISSSLMRKPSTLKEANFKYLFDNVFPTMWKKNKTKKKKRTNKLTNQEEEKKENPNLWKELGEINIENSGKNPCTTQYRTMRPKQGEVR